MLYVASILTNPPPRLALLVMIVCANAIVTMSVFYCVRRIIMPDETTNIQVKLENHEQRLVNAEKRIEDLETDSKVIMQLSNSVQKLAIKN